LIGMIADLVFRDGSGGKEAAKTEGNDSGNSKRLVESCGCREEQI